MSLKADLQKNDEKTVFEQTDQVRHTFFYFFFDLDFLNSIPLKLESSYFDHSKISVYCSGHLELSVTRGGISPERHTQIF